MLRTTEVILDGAMHVSAAKNLVQEQEFLSAGRSPAPVFRVPPAICQVIFWPQYPYSGSACRAAACAHRRLQRAKQQQLMTGPVAARFESTAIQKERIMHFFRYLYGVMVTDRDRRASCRERV